MSAEEVLIVDSDDDSPNPQPNVGSIKESFLEITLSDSESDEDIIIEEQIIKSGIEFVGHGFRSYIKSRKRVRKDYSNSGSLNNNNENQSKDIIDSTIGDRIDPIITSIDIKSERFNDLKNGSVVDNNSNENQSKHLPNGCAVVCDSKGHILEQNDGSVDNNYNENQSKDIYNINRTDPMIDTSNIISKSIDDLNSGSLVDSNSNENGSKQLPNSCAVVYDSNGLTLEQNDDSNSLTQDITDNGNHLDSETDDLLPEIDSNGSPKEENNTKTCNEESEVMKNGFTSLNSLYEEPSKGEYYVCSYDGCEEWFNNALLHYKHEKKHLKRLQDMGIRTFLCRYSNCDFKGLTQIELMYHNSEHRGIYKCRKPNCLFQGKSSQDIDIHMTSHQKPKKRSNKKSYCNCGEPICDRP